MLTKQQTPIAFSGNIPVNYDSYLGPMFFEPYAVDMAERIAKLSPKSLLELAGGTGRLTRFLPSVVAEGGTIIASDINPAMVEFGKSKTSHLNIEWKVVDAAELPFGDAQFDAVAVQFGVMFYGDRVKAFREALRVLKPGGTLIFNCWDEITNNPMALQANETLLHFFPVDTPAFYSVPFSYYDESLMHEELTEAGFREVRIHLVPQTGASASAADAARGLIEGTPTVTAINDRDARILPELIDHLEKKITRLFGAVNLQVPLMARVVTAKK